LANERIKLIRSALCIIRSNHPHHQCSRTLPSQRLVPFLAHVFQRVYRPHVHDRDHYHRPLSRAYHHFITICNKTRFINSAMTIDVFAVPVFFVVFRETLETVVIVSVLLAFLKQTLDGPDRDVVLRKRLTKQVGCY
jgi:hypothetical protein